MTIVTAKAAGVPRVVACTPPIMGEIPSSTIAAMHFAGADDIYVLGGVQAVAAMAIGTETIGKVDFIAGPGNAFVAEAKRQLFGEIGIDLPAGPTEVLIVADDKAEASTVATDLLSQAEHGPDTPAVLITTSKILGEQVIKEVERLLEILPTAALASVSWSTFGEVIIVNSLNEAYKLADTYASEHVQILTETPRDALEKMSNYGALFLGEKTCVSYGDKVSLSPPVSTRRTTLKSISSNICNSRSSVPTTSSPQKALRASLVVSGSENILRPSHTKKLPLKKRVVSSADFAVVPLALRTLKAMRDREM